MDDLRLSKQIAISGMKAQATRLRVISENMANVDSLAKTKGGLPYQRKVSVFKNELDRSLGVNTVKVSKVIKDNAPLDRKYDPTHPAADGDGYILRPNVNPLIEMMDMKEAQRTYDANMNVMNVTKDMVSRTVDMLR